MKNTLRILFKSPRFLIGLVLISITLAFMMIYPMINTGDPKEMVGMKYQPPSSKFPLGTDNFGRDILLELAHGAKTSIYVGFLAGVIATAIGLTLGLIAGYVGGLIDNIVTAITNMFTVIPSFVILILITNALNLKSHAMIGVVIGFTAWPWTARSVRSQTVSLRGRDHVNIAKISGYSTGRIILTEILPYIASYVVMAFTLQLASGILAEASLSMLGLAPSNSVSLGLMLQWALWFSAPRIKAWWGFIPTSIMIAVVTFSLYMMNSGMDEIFNPKIRS